MTATFRRIKSRDFSRRHLIIAGTFSLVLAIGLSIVIANLGGDDPGYGSGGEEMAALLYSSGEAVPDDFEDRNAGLIETAYAELETRYGIGEDDLYDASANPEGYRVALTIDEDLQTAVEDIEGEAGAVAVEPGSGAVLCYYGAESETGADQVGAAAPHPPSSVFDMVTAATALQDGASIDSWWSDEDSDVTLTDAVRDSRSAAVDDIAEQYGAESVLQTASAMGLTAITDADGTARPTGEDADYSGLKAADLDTYAVSVLDMAAVYATIAGDGVYADTHFIDRVVDAKGNTVEADRGIASLQAISTTTARDLQFVGLGGGDALEERDFFGLSGEWTDDPEQSWYVGAIPQLSVAAWVGGSGGGDDDPPGVPVWRSVVDTAIEAFNYAPEEFDGAVKAGSDITDGIENDDGSIDPESEYCEVNPTAEACGGATEEPSEDEPSSEEPTDDETTEEPEPDPTTTSEEPEPEPTTEEPSESPTECDWLDPNC
ncbi:penicillin-binding transpeptidase domain-containing protein [Glycomyces buryatensis]|uniref:Penicillin-binding protein transpeptidase domain-containing protein n=1 Tax=Glycomyces buryatensis TaxID=2570927 RepID=A0A4S8QLZ0_9ACTN|nr:penicillin-binding transpeptidase domain-containing protein [Glycomyces buryatensis]THV41754.1 hypothetical protein FAB82_10220 [Glycomyces buryatensis]